MNEETPERRWGPRLGDRVRISQHLERQRGLNDYLVRLDNGQVVVVGADAAGEADECE